MSVTLQVGDSIIGSSLELVFFIIDIIIDDIMINRLNENFK